MPVEHKSDKNNITVDVDALNDVANKAVDIDSINTGSRMIYVIYISTRSSIPPRDVNICASWNLRLWYRLDHRGETKYEPKWALFALGVAFEL